MAEISKKSMLILEHEKQFANTLAFHVIDKPKLSLWMILIPIFFVYYFYQHQKYVNGRKMFAEHYLVSKKRALNEAVEVVNTGKNPDIDELTKLSDVPDDVRGRQAKVLTVLIEHFVNLLRAEGEDFESLVRSAYNNRTNYLLFLNHLNKAEKEANTALKPHLRKTHEGINDIVSTIELHSERLRRENAEKIFPFLV